ncbi:MAG: PIN domain-containing protein [Gemmatimonadetes bacterium]|nr:PIN domain-containing protein [Gemmatimonadota bacterium]MYC00048.1 PIN domain-containing protein [Gemmatimonadota bacterium]MYH51511.1 PIN domain-containing protein [Gemmatimonadota bacterium]MYK65071.1 PIN domain-containing protein [Gemmatimonadota bacterium]
MRPTVVVDTGPIVALLDADEARHDWARARFEELRAPLLTCEAVLSEASFLLRRAGADPSLPARLVRRGVLEVAGLFESDADTDALVRLMRRYASFPMSFADACLVRIVERTPNGSVMTLDSGFHIYRQAGRRTIPLLIPSP